jgi:acyl transferase domain-containing protein/NAD(P)H-dependent flavin oxidoreductase YrpB (nitropropane dioxygenase family)/NAD(P)-dependent dehydrogenase (short-subunit alcohol dehydrogenase family)/acyl carrier protein
MRAFGFLSLAPPGLTGVRLPLAVGRAGGIGVLDVSFAASDRGASSAIDRLSAANRDSWGLRLSTTSGAVLDTCEATIPVAVMDMSAAPEFPEFVRRVLRRCEKLLIAVTSAAEAAAAIELGATGLIARGHESGGRIGEETTFILLQRILARTSLPVWAQGGIGLHTIAGAYAAGVAGVVLDSQLWLTRESALPEPARKLLGRMDGSDTVCVKLESGETWRIFRHPGKGPGERRAIADLKIEWSAVEENLWPIGQDGVFAAPLAQRFKTAGGVLEGLRQSLAEHVVGAQKAGALRENAPLAQSHATRFPIVQGPMTRVSDTTGFAESVAQGGALPFVALALMRGANLDSLLAGVRARLANKPWGVGILGFVPLEIREEQLRAIRAHKPPFALIAGGRPDQAQALEEEGIPTYLHVPSPRLLEMFVDNGACRFVFEGRECGGHVGPYTSFVLWDQMVETLLRAIGGGVEPGALHVLFAGGIQDALSSSMVAALAGTLSEKGVKVGVLMGTAYLFTPEAVASGAIAEGFQAEAIRCQETVLLESGPGYATRCASTPFADTFRRERERLLKESTPAEEMRDALEDLNLGRLRIASKGLVRDTAEARDRASSRLVPVSAEEQRASGLYMLGQVAALRQDTCTIEELHRAVATRGDGRIQSLRVPRPAAGSAPKSCDIAIVGMSCLLPKAPELRTMWLNTLGKVNAISEVPADRWDWRTYFDADPDAPDKVYSRWGGFLDDLVFDPLKYGLPPSSLSSIEPVQLLMLEAVGAALENAGYADREFCHERAAVIAGVGGGLGDLGQQYVVRSAIAGERDKALHSTLPEWTEDSFAGILPNVVTGRVANRFDLKGVNYTVDAACASSLAALYLAARELETGSSDMVIAGAADTLQGPFTYLCFSKAHALSKDGRCRAFDQDANGTVISEGLAVLILKRLADAERDGDRIWAVLKGVAGSSDGRDRGLMAPRREGQVRALERAYTQAGVSPSTVGLIEAHGTGTALGDQVEAESLTEVFRGHGAAARSCALGSVKSMIGHTKSAAGFAGLIKAALALHDKVLPPTLGIETPNAKALPDGTPFYVNTETRPWIAAGGPRRAGVSAFGFGGTNFHAVLEEYDAPDPALGSPTSEVLVFSGQSRQEVCALLDTLHAQFERGARPRLEDLSYTVWRNRPKAAPVVLAIAAVSLDDLHDKLKAALAALRDANRATIEDARGIYLYAEAATGKIAFLFPGQGSQYPGMLSSAAIRFPEVRESFETADAVLLERLGFALSSFVFPPPAFGDEAQQAAAQDLMRTNVAQPALGVAGMAMYRLLGSLGIHPDMATGHSYGEYVALCAAGALSAEALYSISETRGRCILDAAQGALGSMAALDAGAVTVRKLLEGMDAAWIANLNSPAQTAVSGTEEGLAEVTSRANNAGIHCRRLPVSCGFHSPLMGGARAALAAALSKLAIRAPRFPVYSNCTAKPYPENTAEAIALLSQHLVTPVDFAGTVEEMYAAGARIFIEVGPKAVLTGLTNQILGERPHLAIATDAGPDPMLPRFHRVLAELVARGVSVNLDRLFEGREVRELNLEMCDDRPRPPPTAWLVNGGRARPMFESTSKAKTTAPLQSVGPQTEIVRQHPSEASVPPPDLNIPTLPPGNNDQSMLHFQQIMNKFLETQREVMLAYLGGPSAAPAPTPAPFLTPWSSTPEAVQPKTNGAPALPEPAAWVPAEPAKTGASGQASIRDTLLAIVSERTGYPVEALDPKLNLEADLGVDSLKIAEILTTLQRECGDAKTRVRDLMEKLTRAKTLERMIELIEAAPPPPAQPLDAPSAAELPRCVPALLKRPAIAHSPQLSGTLLLTEDSHGVARALTELLARLPGVRIARLGKDFYPADLCDEESVRRCLARIRTELGPIGGIIHLRGIYTDGDSKAGQDALSFLLLVKAASEDIRSRSGVVLSTSQPAAVRTISLEWTGVRCRALDLQTEMAAPEAALRIFEELGIDDREPAVSYRGDTRLVMTARVTSRVNASARELGPDSVLLITGGGRGITAEVACGLAARYKSKLVIMGRSLASEERPETIALNGAREIKGALLELSGETRPREIEAEYNRIVRSRELRRNIQRMKDAGAPVQYVPIDVTDESAFSSAIDAVYRAYGRIDGVLHGAGIIEDKLVDGKTAASFERVFDSKVRSAYTLSRAIRPESLKFMVFFSSIAGCFGNRGQIDYAAANEELNRLAVELNARWPGRVFSACWGPWAGAGMASSSLEAEFVARGISMIAPKDGVQALDWELRYGSKDEPIVILGAGPWVEASAPGPPAAASSGSPLGPRSTVERDA